MFCSCRNSICRVSKTAKYYPPGAVLRSEQVSTLPPVWNRNHPRFGDRDKRKHNKNFPQSSKDDEVSGRSPLKAEEPVPFRREFYNPDPKDLPPSMRKKYRLFTDESEEILDSAKTQWVEIEAPAEQPEVDEFEGLNMERGLNGVMDVEDLVHVLRLENAADICVIYVPPEMRYTEHLVVATGRSSRQLLGMAEFVRRYYKKKKLPSDSFLENSLGISKWKQEWVALDLGNIVLHLMDKKTREKYDIESLWALGPDYDPLCQIKKDPLVELLEQHSRPAGAGDESAPPRKVPLARWLR